MRGYLALARGGFMVGLMYRFGFIFAILGNLLYMTVAYFLWRTIYANSTTLNGLTFDQTFLYLALGSAVFVILKTYVDWELSYQIREGNIALQLARPLDFTLYTMFSSLGILLMNLVALTIPTVLIVIFIFKTPFPLGIGLLFFPFSIVFAYLISFSFDYIVGLVAFYTDSVWGLSKTKEIIISLLSGMLIPLPFFPDAIEKILLYLPFQGIFNTPLMMVVRPDQNWDVYAGMLAVQAFWALVMLAATRLFYVQAIKVLRIAGG